MLLTKIKPNWKHIHFLHNKSFIHFNLQTFGLNHVIPYDFIKSYNYLPPDKYIKQDHTHKTIINNGETILTKEEDIVTRSRRYANLKVDVRDNYEYRIHHTTNDVFKQSVDDSRSIERKFELIDLYHINQLWILELITHVSALSILNNRYYKGHKKIKEVDVHIHQVRQTTYPEIDTHNSPEGVHRDGADTIVSAFIINRNNVTGGESVIYDEQKNMIYKTILQNQEGLFMEDVKQWHYVTPIECVGTGLGFRDIVGLDIILNT